MQRSDALATKVAVEVHRIPERDGFDPVNAGTWYEATVRAQGGEGELLFRSERNRSRAYARQQAEAFRRRLIAEAEDQDP